MMISFEILDADYELHLKNKLKSCSFTYKLSNYEFEEPYPSLNDRIDECMNRCNANLECNFIFQNFKSCIMYSSCDGTRTTDYEGFTFQKQVKGNMKRLK